MKEIIVDYKVDKKQKNKVKFTISLEKEEWQKALEDAYNKTKNKYSVVGFRAGKAPRKVVEKTYGENVFFEEALSDSFYKHYFDILAKEKDLKVVDEQPSINILDISQDGLRLEVETNLQPEVEIAKYTGFGIETTPKKVLEKDVKAELDKLVEQNVRFVEVETPSENGNIVNIDFSGTMDGKKFDGGTSEGYDLELGSHSFIEGFEEQLVGLKPGEEKDVEVTFPKNYQEKSLAGKPATFHVKVNAIKKKEYPTVDDAFIEDVTEFETLEEYKKATKKHLNEHAKEHAQRELETLILEKVLENTKVELPESMIEHEVEHIMGDFENRLMYQGLTLDMYLNYIKTTKEAFRKDRREDAEKNVKLSLALQHIMNKENLAITEKDIDEELAKIAESMKTSLEEYKKMVDDHTMGHVRNDILMRKLVEFLVKNN